MGEEERVESLGGETPDEVGGLGVGEVPSSGYDAFFEVFWVVAVAEHLLVVVGLEESDVAECEVLLEPWANVADVGEYSDVDSVDLDAEAARLLDIVWLVEAVCGERTDCYGVSDVEESYVLLCGSVFDSHAVESASGHVGQGSSVAAQGGESVNVVGVLV